jgi:hypothetical protein
MAWYLTNLEEWGLGNRSQHIRLVRIHIIWILGTGESLIQERVRAARADCDVCIIHPSVQENARWFRAQFDWPDFDESWSNGVETRQWSHQNKNVQKKEDCNPAHQVARSELGRTESFLPTACHAFLIEGATNGKGFGSHMRNLFI